MSRQLRAWTPFSPWGWLIADYDSDSITLSFYNPNTNGVITADRAGRFGLDDIQLDTLEKPLLVEVVPFPGLRIKLTFDEGVVSGEKSLIIGKFSETRQGSRGEWIMPGTSIIDYP